MDLRAALLLVLAACAADTSPVPVDQGADTAVDAAAPMPDTASGPAVDAPTPVDCVECVMQCLTENCLVELLACQVSQCDEVGGPDGGGDAFYPPNCEQIVTCLIDNACNPLGGPGDPCFDACYQPACAEAKAVFDTLSECAVEHCVKDCFGCE